MKVHILFRFKDEPTGGGNQFLKSLKEYLQSVRTYEEDIKEADVVLFNSYQYIDEAAKVKLEHPDKLFVHRIDGPIRLYNKISDKRDYVTNTASHLIAEATIFQSEWSRRENLRLGLKKNAFEAVITNAPNPTIFNREEKIPFSTGRKVRLIATSWSSNWKKGFQVYQWLDEHLDFNRYEMIFVGNSPVEFKNIKHNLPLNSKDIARELKKNDIFVFASPIEACSNSLLEALHCGLPVVGVDGSSNPELIGKAGETFTKADEIPELLEKIVKNYAEYQTNICNPSISEVGKLYCDFISRIYQQTQSGASKFKSFGRMSYARVTATIYRWKLSERIAGIINEIGMSK